MKPVLHFATKLNSSVIQKRNFWGVPSYDLFTSARRFKSSISCANGDWRSLIGPLCFLSWSTIMAQEEDVPGVHPLRVKFKYSVRGQEIMMCNCDWWKGVWGRSNLITTRKFYSPFWTKVWTPLPPSPIKNSWICSWRHKHFKLAVCLHIYGIFHYEILM